MTLGEVFCATDDIILKAKAIQFNKLLGGSRVALKLENLHVTYQINVQ